MNELDVQAVILILGVLDCLIYMYIYVYMLQLVVRVGFCTH